MDCFSCNGGVGGVFQGGLNKVEHLEKILEEIEYIRLSLRLLRDLRVLNDEKYTRVVVLCEDVAVQFEKWCSYERGEACGR